MKENISFRIIQWNVEEIPDQEIVIHISGLTIDNKQVYCKVKNFLPHCYLELPWDYNWKKADCAILWDHIQKKLKECPPESYKMCIKRTTLYALKRKYLCIRFYTTSSYRHLANLVKYEWNIDGLGEFPKHSFKLHEQNINTEIKFCVEKDIDPSGWIDVTGHSKSFSTCDYSLIVDAKNVERSKKYTNDDQIDPRICVFDIELHSINRKSASPKSDVEGNVITMISLIFGRLSSPDWDVHTVSLYNCTPKIGVVYDCKSSEKKLLKTFIKILKKYRPDIITGYNINGFDWGAILTRMQIHGIVSETGDKYELPFTMGKLDKGDVIKDLMWGSSARGKQEKKYVSMQGILNFDLFTEISFNYKLPTYHLGHVSSHFLKGETKDDMPYQQMFILKDMIASVLNPTIDGIELDVATSMKLIKSQVSPAELLRTSDGEGGTVVNHPADMLIEIKKCKTVKKILEVCEKYWKKMVDYCIQDTLIIPKLMKKLNSLINIWENSNICKVPASFIFDRGQQIKVTAGIVNKFKYNDHVFDYVKKEVHNDDDSEDDDDKKKYQGANVLQMKHGLHRQVVILDFTSLYPSIMKDKNMCYTTYRANDDTRVKDEDCWIAEWEEHRGCEHDLKGSKNKNVLCGKHRHRFLKPVEGDPDTIGTLPLFIDELLNYRVSVKNQMKEPEKKYKELLIKTSRTPEEEALMESYKSKYDILDSRQNAIKVMCNSIYGYTGISRKMGTQPCEAIAASVTHYSRYYICTARDLLLKRWNNLEVVYGDTDSLFLKWNGVTLEESFKLGYEASKYLALHLPQFIQMKFENVYDPVLLITPKKYDYNVVDEKGNIIKEDSKGSIMSRRDNCDVARDIYKTVNKCIKNVKPFEDTIYELNEKILDMFRRRYPLKKYVIYMCLKKDIEEYKNIAGHIRFAERLTEIGNEVKANTRLEFVFVKNTDSSAKTGDRMEDWKTFLMSEGLQIDYCFYVERKLVNVITKILNLAYPVIEKNYIKHDEEFLQSMNCFLKPKWFTALKGLPLQKKALYIIRNSVKVRLRESAKRFYSEWLLEKIFKKHGLPYRYHYRKRPASKKTVVYANDRIVGNIAKYHVWWSQVSDEIKSGKWSLKPVKK